MDSSCGRRISLETAKFLGVPFVVRAPGSTAVWRYVHREDETVLQVSIMAKAYWDAFINDETMKHVEEKYGLELYEPHEEESR